MTTPAANARLAEAGALVMIARERYPEDEDLQAAARCIAYTAAHLGIPEATQNACVMAFYTVYTKGETE